MTRQQNSLEDQTTNSEYSKEPVQQLSSFKKVREDSFYRILGGTSFFISLFMIIGGTIYFVLQAEYVIRSTRQPTLELVLVLLLQALPIFTGLVILAIVRYLLGISSLHFQHVAFIDFLSKSVKWKMLSRDSYISIVSLFLNSIFIKHKGSRKSNGDISPALLLKNELNELNDARIVAAGQWVLKRFSEGQMIMAVPEDHSGIEDTIKELLDNRGAKLHILKLSRTDEQFSTKGADGGNNIS